MTQPLGAVSVQSGRCDPFPAAVRRAPNLASDDSHQQLIFLSTRYHARDPAHIAAVLPAPAAVGRRAYLPVAINAVERIRPREAGAECRVARAPGVAAVGGDERALLGGHRPVLLVLRVHDDV